MAAIGPRDLASRNHVRNAAESGQARTDANDPPPVISFRDYGNYRWADIDLDARRIAKAISHITAASPMMLSARISSTRWAHGSQFWNSQRKPRGPDRMAV